MSWNFIAKSKKSFFILLVTSILPVTLSSISLLYLTKYEQSINTFGLVEWAFFFTITAITMALAMTPTTFIALITGYFIGWIGIIGIIPSYLCASIIGFTIAKSIDNKQFSNQITSYTTISSMVEGIKKKEFTTIFYARLNPVLPFAMLNFLLAFLNVSFKNFVSAGLIGMLPRTILSLYIGTQTKNIIAIINGEEKIEWTQLIIIALFIFSALGLYKIIIQSIKKAVQ